MSRDFNFGKLTPNRPDFKALKRMADDDPVRLIELCRKRTKAIKMGTRRMRWHRLVAVYAGAFGLRDSPRQFETLLTHDYFKGRTYEANIRDVLRLAILVGTNADTSGPTYKQACREAASLQAFFEADVEPEVLLDAIEAARGLKRLWSEDEEPDDEVVEAKSGSGNADVQNSEDAERDPGTGRSQNGKSPRPSRPPPRPDGPPAKSELEIEATPTRRDRVLSLPVGGRARITVERVAAGTDWKRIVATAAKVIA